MKHVQLTLVLITSAVVLLLVGVLAACVRRWRLLRMPCRTVSGVTDETVNWRDLHHVASNGDLIVQSSLGDWSAAGLWAVGAEFTHVGALWFDDNNVPYIAEATVATHRRSSDVRVHPITNALSAGKHMIVRTLSTPGPRSRAPLDNVLERYNSGVCATFASNIMRYLVMWFGDMMGEWFLRYFSGSKSECFVRAFDACDETMCIDFAADVLRAYGAEPNHLAVPNDSYYFLPYQYVCNDALSADGSVRFSRTLRIVD